MLLVRLILVLMISTQAFADIKLNINFVRRKKMDKRLVLFNEIHESVIIQDGEEKIIPLKNNLGLKVKSTFQDNFSHFGPVPLFEITTTIFKSDRSGETFLASSKKEVEMGKQVMLYFKDPEGHSIELSVVPEVQ